VFRILQVIRDNLAQGPATVRLPGSVPTTSGFRGRVVLDPARCIACGMCAYVCVSDAISGVNEEQAYGWGYDPGRCSFCARCLERCPGHALTMTPEPVPTYARQGELAAHQRVPFPPCAQCSAPVRPATEELLRLAFGHVTEELRELAHLCERCRRKRLQRSLAAGALNPEENEP